MATGVAVGADDPIGQSMFLRALGPGAFGELVRDAARMAAAGQLESDGVGILA